MIGRIAVALASTAAAYTPIPALELSDRSPGQAPALTSTYTQPAGQPATRTVGARFPPAFTYNPDFAVAGCAPAAEEAAACPAETRLGTVEVRTVFGDASGPVHLMEDLRLVGFLGAFAGLIQTRIVGVIGVHDDGSAELVFDDLPDVPVRYSRIALEGGAHGMIVTPRRCRAYEVATRFVSHGGETSEHALPVVVEGCPGRLVVRAVRLDGRTLRWTAAGAAHTQVTLLRRGARGWRELRTWRVEGTALALPGSLRTGAYRAQLRAFSAEGRASRARWARVTLR